MNARIEADDFILRARALEASGRALLRPRHEIWGRLASGICRVKDAFVDEQTCYLVLCEPSAGESAIRPLQLEILEKILHGSGQKLLAIDLNLSCSTITTVVRRALASLGVDCKPSRVPLALVIAAQASNDVQERLTAGVATFAYEGREHLVVSMRRPDCDLSSLLSPAEVEVVRAQIEGHSHRNIAGLRQTSPRTIANQLGAVPDLLTKNKARSIG